MSNPPTSQPSGPAGGAVFVSYAREDTAAASRICEALRAAGNEVWFDQNELGGGDAWDRKIRAQIGGCALFVPVVSAATQARREGYFRLEWKLADERTHLMAEGTPFILPVVIDDTKEREALVPKSFLDVQWTRLPGGEAGAAFGARARKLLAADVGASLDDARAARTTDGRGRATPLQNRAAPAGRRVPAAAWAGALAVIVIGAGATFFATRKSEPAAAAMPNAGAGISPRTTEKARPTRAEEKSVAVLPFVTLGADKDDENLADGIADELLTQLGRAPGLRVSGRLSSFSFKGQKLTDAEIARKLEVEYLVTGTFQKNGSQVRIRPQLINAPNGSVLWGETFTKELTNVFALQDEVAGLIAQTLQVKLGAAARAARTVNPAAYGLVQKGRYLWLKRSDDALAESIVTYEEAIKLDSNYAEAYAGLADAALVRGWYSGLEGVNQGGLLFRRAREAAQEAVRLDATLAEPHAALGGLNLNERRLEEAEQEFQTALRLNPNYSYGHHWHAHLLALRGRIDEAIAKMERATQIDPYSLSTLVINAVFLAHAGRHAEATTMIERALAVQPGFLPAHGVRAMSLLKIGRRDEALQEARIITKDASAKTRWWMDANAIFVLRQLGLEAEAKTHAERLLAAAPKDSYFRVYVAGAMGQADEALEALRRTPVISTAQPMVYFSDSWDEVRRSPRFIPVLRELGWAEHYETARATKARMLR